MITTFCPRCGSENPFENQFCGKCGIPLLQPKPAGSVAAARANGSHPASSVEESEPDLDQNLHGPSFLGLSDEPDLSSSYLLDDEVSSSHWGLYLFLLVLAVAAGLVWWQARHGGLNRSHLATLVQQARSKIGQEKQEAAAVAPNANPAAAENAGVTTPPPVTGNSTAGPGAPANGQPSAAVAPPPSPAQMQSAAKNVSAAPSALRETAAAAKPPAPEARKAEARSAPAEAKKTAPAADAQNAQLLNNAQRYLYGNGVPQSCDRALSYLRQAVDNDSAKAKSTLGGLYATGHCVPLDRAVAYKWFAQALRQDPNNSYLSHDLEMLWNQMTPAQKQLAIRMTQ